MSSSSTLAGLKAEKATLDAEIEKLTKEELVRHQQDKSGKVEVMVLSSRNVEESSGDQRYILSVLPGGEMVEVEVRRTTPFSCYALYCHHSRLSS